MKKNKWLIGVTTALLTVLTGAVVYAANGYSMTYLSGTQDKVANMPPADSGVGGQPYFVSQMIPERDGK